MRNLVSKSLLLAAIAVSSLSFAVTLKPTTTITAEKSNNTSAALAATQSNGNLGATNISKQNLRTLLPSASNARVIAVYQPWFRLPYHMEIGYDEHTTTQVQKQVEDAISRGVTGFMVNWYGQPLDSDKRFMDNVTLLVRNQAEAHPGFGLALQYDGGAIRNWTGDKTQKVIDDLNYAASLYFNSPSYIRKNNRPIIEFFSIDEAGPVDWNRIRAGVQGNPIFLHRNIGGFTHAQSDGAYGWLGINSTWTTAVTYNDQFYQTALKYPTMVVVAPVWTGFNDTLASWTANRITPRACGQVWLKGWSQLKQYYPNGTVDFVELNTWNDYEEGTELESGVDDCNTIAASVTGTALSWSVTGGTLAAVDHYEVYASADGNNAAMLTQMAAGNYSIDLAQFNLDPGTYQIYVKSVGKPNIANHMSNAAAFTVAPTITVALSVAPSTGIAPLPVTATANTGGSGSVASTTINFGDGTVVSGNSATHTYATAGTYTVTATATDTAGNQKSTTSVVTVAANQLPIAALSLSLVNGIAPAAVTASTAASTDTDGTIASSSINFGDGTVMSGPSATHTYAAAGTYTVTATITDDKGGQSSTSSTVKLTAPAVTVTAPVAGTTADSPVHFIASASAPTGRTISSMAVIVDGATAYSINAGSLDANVTIAPGAHSVSVNATDSAGATYSSTAVSININNKPPTASLALSTASAVTGAAVNATVTAADVDGTIASYSINFGDGFIATTATASHAYAAAGTYTVTATATDNNGGTATSTAVVNVVAPGVYVSSPTAGSTVGSPVHFVANVIASAGATPTLTRIYVDGVSTYEVRSASLDANVTIAGGSHNVVVQAWDSAGTVFKSPMTVNVPMPNQAPTVALTLSANSVVTGATVTANVTASDADGTIASYSVDFGDGYVVTTSSASHAYTTAGTYTVTASATDNNGAKTTTTSTMKIVVPGVYVTTAAQGATAGSAVHFVASVMTNAGRTPSTMRIYVDGVSVYQVSGGSLDTYVKMAAGTHSVVVQAWDTLGTVYKAPLTITAR